jgi:hypothetical protein
MPWFRRYWAINRELVVEDAASGRSRRSVGPVLVLASGAVVEEPRDRTAHRDAAPLEQLRRAHLEPQPQRQWLRSERGGVEVRDPGVHGSHQVHHLPAAERPPFGNVAVFADNDRMFHRVGPIGTPTDRLPSGSLSAAAALTHRTDGTWAIEDGDAEIALDASRLRVSILWTAMCFDTAEELRMLEDGDDLLTLEQVTETFAHDLAQRGERFELPDDAATTRSGCGSSNASIRCRPSRLPEDAPRQTKSAFTSRNSSRPCSPCSRPRPDCL